MLPDGSVYQTSNPSHMYHHGIRSTRRDPRIIATAPRSVILEEFRSNKARKWELQDIIGHIVEFSRDQHGSRFIQQRIENASNDEKQAIFDEIVPSHTLPLMQDVFGNYVIQKLFEFGSQQQKTILVNAMDGQVLALTLQMYGCRVVQKAIENILPEQQSLLVRQIEPHVLRCVKDSNGNHVVQKLVERVSAERLGFIYAFRGNVYDLATHPYGCRVLQRCLEHLPEEQTQSLMEEVLANAHKLMTDQFGNYVMQFILEHGKAKDKALVISKLRGQLLYMSRHKFASNVCEKALLFSDSESRRSLIDEIILTRPDGFMPYPRTNHITDYVLQRALVVSEGDQRELLYTKVKPQLAQMRKFATPYSKHLVSSE
ncbi:armadillo-type protein [Cyathus striatus]|nr:armadillo-type protein [Cyathus striatus]